MNYVKYIVIFIPFFCAMEQASAEEAQRVLQVPEHMKSCNSRPLFGECTSVSTALDFCCTTDVINKKYEKEYEELFMKKRKSFKGGVCDCVPSEIFDAECVESQCTKTNIRPWTLEDQK